ncbi:response regulator [Pseudoalteromonas denitrificans]|uniref:Pilus assembly protein CpaE n=1 Tax=Pseudoalteromonas denitrificans DSM 6059 TaxID=1123010 RepID=A0A1I1LPI3_9GAMM|nr:response regulator [Pseudoalteromonas denitrificans]SFC74939.1 pilus assembly protein CpaE [Pseudoalteromonas denitrificans DSM 6059]
MSYQTTQSNIGLSESSEQSGLTAFVSDKASELLVDKVFTHFPATELQKIIIGGVQKAIEHLRNHVSPHVLIVDIQTEDEPLAAITTLATVCEPGTRVIVIGNDVSVDLYRELKEMGVDDYLCKPLNQEQLVHAIGRASGQIKHQNTRNAKQIAITGCSGGVGVSTLIANIGRALALHGAQTLITDLDCYGGDLDLLLDSNAGFGLMNLLSEQNSIDKIFIERACQQISERLFLLKSMGQRQDFDAASYQKLRHVLSEEYNYLLWDLPSHLLNQQGISDTLIGADIQILVCAPTMAGLRQCKALLSQLGERQYGQRTLLVLNQIYAPRDVMLDQMQMEQSLGRKFDHVLPYAPKVALKAAELGQSLLSDRHAIGRSLNLLSEDILGISKPKKNGLFKYLSILTKKTSSKSLSRGY